MKKSEMICESCLCRIDSQPGDVIKDLCALGPVRYPVHPKYFCGSGKWTEQYGSVGLPRSYGEWKDE